jgi:signal transduction histidine kinase
LVLEQRLAGVLIVFKAGWDSGFTQQEVELVRTVAAGVLLILQYLGCLRPRMQEQTRTLVQREVEKLSNDFLTLASHELYTPLTGIKGNLQLAQRRLSKVKRQIAEQVRGGDEQMEWAKQPLAQAVESAQLQERIIQDMIDDARIQANTLTLSLSPSDLLPLVQAAVRRLREAVPERTITLSVPTTIEKIPVMADAERIIQVLFIYLTNALAHSSAEQPVTVQVSIENALARVCVHDEGAGIPKEEQEHLWDRFYRSKGDAVQNELDLSLGLSFYLCQALIERHQGSVGVQSDVGHGTTFWFTLPC